MLKKIIWSLVALSFLWLLVAYAGDCYSLFFRECVDGRNWSISIEMRSVLAVVGFITCSIIFSFDHD